MCGEWDTETATWLGFCSFSRIERKDHLKNSGLWFSFGSCCCFYCCYCSVEMYLYYVSVIGPKLKPKNQPKWCRNTDIIKLLFFTAKLYNAKCHYTDLIVQECENINPAENLIWPQKWKKFTWNAKECGKLN